MRNITNIRKLKEGKLPVLKLTINGTDYSDNLVDCDKLFVDKTNDKDVCKELRSYISPNDNPMEAIRSEAIAVKKLAKKLPSAG